MKLPDQFPPVDRAMESSLGARAIVEPMHLLNRSNEGQGSGVTLSGYEQCYRLRGLAQQLCLENY